MLQDTGKASSLGSRRKLDNVSQDNRWCMSSRVGGWAGGAAWAAVQVVLCVCVCLCARASTAARPDFRRADNWNRGGVTAIKRE